MVQEILKNTNNVFLKIYFKQNIFNLHSASKKLITLIFKTVIFNYFRYY